MNDDSKKTLESASMREENETELLPMQGANIADARVEGDRGGSPQAEEEDETWTNQPAASVEELMNEDSDSAEDEEPSSVPAPRKAIETARDVVCEEMPHRAQRAAARLKPYLTGVVVIEFSNSGEKFVFDWRGETALAKAVPQGTTVTTDEAQGFVWNEKVLNVDTVVAVSEVHLMAIRSGALNPQVGMLTDKIRVQGKVAPAVYIFNLVAPRTRA